MPIVRVYGLPQPETVKAQHGTVMAAAYEATLPNFREEIKEEISRVSLLKIDSDMVSVFFVPDLSLAPAVELVFLIDLDKKPERTKHTLDTVAHRVSRCALRFTENQGSVFGELQLIEVCVRPVDNAESGFSSFRA